MVKGTVCWTVPEVATTEIFAVTGGGVDDDPPQAEMSAKVEAMAVMTRNLPKKRLRRLPKRRNAMARIGPVDSGMREPGRSPD